MFSTEKKLGDALSSLKELGESVDQLESSFPEIFDDPSWKMMLENFRQEHEEALKRLEKPTLSIATLGTTSSGKSTIVNALIGHKVAPMEAGEMSGGVLKFQHSSSEHQVSITDTDNAVWETGIFQGDGNDQALYNRISQVMQMYHTERAKNDCSAPQVQVSCSLLPAVARNLLGLPEGIDVELIDLPGLKSIQDRANLDVIQKQVYKAFNIIALDYSQVDDDHRRVLLQELKTVVEFLGKTDDAMVFVLNRTDRRTDTDMPLCQRIDMLKEEIQQELGLKEPPEILPFSALILYYAQCAWGATSIEDLSSVSQSTRLELLNAMRVDCATVIEKQINEDQDLDNWFHMLKGLIRNGDIINDETMKQVLRYALEWSGGKELWSRLHTRIQESFSELVIFPAVAGVLKSYGGLSEAIQNLARVRKLDSKEKVDAEQEKLNSAREQLNQSIEELRDKFSANMEALVSSLQDAARDEGKFLDARSEAVKYHEGFSSLVDAVTTVNKDLLSKLIVPVSEALEAKVPVFQLKKQLKEVTTSLLAEEITEAYERVKDAFVKFEASKDGMLRRVLESDGQGKKELKLAENAVKKLYLDMQDALSKRAEFVLQGQSKTILEALQSLINEQRDELASKCCDLLPNIKLDAVIVSAFYHKESQDLPTLPERFFNPLADVEGRTGKEEKIVGTKTVQKVETLRRRWLPFWKYKKTIFEVQEVKEAVEYNELLLPDHSKMAEAWSASIEQEKQELWEVIREWVVESLKHASEDFNTSINDAIDLVGRELEEQRVIIQQNLEEELQRWKTIEMQTYPIEEVYQKLKATVLTSKGENFQ